LNPLDRLFWTALRRIWWRWAEVLVVVKPQTVVGWHRAGFRLFWRWRSGARGGRPKSTAEIRALIRGAGLATISWGCLSLWRVNLTPTPGQVEAAIAVVEEGFLAVVPPLRNSGAPTAITRAWRGTTASFAQTQPLCQN
jgi:hypothetical protein